MEKGLNKKIAFIGSIVSILLVATVGFAYFSATVVNTNNERLSTETATLSLKFEDGDNGVSGTLNLGESITKKFTIENTGSLDAYAKINFVDLINTYKNNSLIYVLEQSDTENGTYVSISDGYVPVSSESTVKKLVNGIFIPVNTKYYYKLTIKLNNLNVEQNQDINAEMHSHFNIVNVSELGTTKITKLVDGADQSSTNVIIAGSSTSACTNTLAYDGTKDNNLRYVGSNPCNYVKFNNESWRIIGVMNNIDDGTGKLESRIKLVRKDYLGDYSWDSSPSNINIGHGVSNWSQADLMYELNSDYLNTDLKMNTLWYSGSSNYKHNQYNYTKGLTIESQNLVGQTKWNVGGHYSSILPTSSFYINERGTARASSSYPTTWIGKVALIYPSDYGYAVGGAVRANCLKTNLSSYSSNSCCWNDWLANINGHSWTLAPSASNSRYAYMYGNIVDSNYLYSNYMVYPSVYLRSGVSIINGNGSPENPYILE